MAEEHGVFGPALIGAELLRGASVLGRHQLLGHAVAVDAGETVFPPLFRHLVSEEELAAWQEGASVQFNKVALTTRRCVCTIVLSVSSPSLQKKQSRLLTLLASPVIFSILQYSHKLVTKLSFLYS